MAEQYFAMLERQHERETRKPRANRVGPAAQKPKENRDPNNINSHVQCQYYDVLAEPSTSPQTFDCIWEFSEVAFDCCKTCWYKLLGLLCGCCIAVAWAIEFVPLIASHVWCFTPIIQLCKIIVSGCCKPIWYLCTGLCVVPCTQSCAYLFHNFSYGRMTRPPTPQLFPDRPKKRSVPKPVEKKKKEPAVAKKNETAVPVPVVAAAATGKRSEFDDFDKGNMAQSVRRQLMLV